MLKKNYLYDLSIIIPTKNRQIYCIKSVEEIIKNTGDNVEIIIQDNSDDGSFIKNYCDNVNQKRVQYHYNSSVLSFVDNFSEAVGLANGKYLCMIGDDDGVLPSIGATLDYVIQNDLDCYIPGLNSVYIWPSKKPFVKGAENGYLCLAYFSSSKRHVDVEENLKKLLKQGFQDYQKLDVPRLYHGLVHHRILDAIKEKTGTYFKGLTPDMYMVVALCFACKKVEACNLPITISGICPRSGSSASATGAHTGDLKDAPHFLGHTNYEWDIRVPSIYTVETIWAETGLHALKKLNMEEWSKLYNQQYTLSRLWWKYPQFHKVVKEHGSKYDISQVAICINANQIRLQYQLKRAIRRLTRKRGDVDKIFNVLNIEDAALFTEKKLIQLKS